MRTQLNCPNCGAPIVADMHQIIDVGRNPELKQLLLSGQLNVAVCQSCGSGGQIAAPLLYHDPAHDLFMVHVPEQVNMDQRQREDLIGRLTRQVMESTPPEQRRAYMFQPQMMLTMKSFLERVLETEGITPEMIARQQRQVQLLQTLARADADVAAELIKDRKHEIDETFFAMLRAYIETATQMNDDKQLLPLLNLQAKLMTETEVGRRLERLQVALHAFSRDAKKEEGVSPLLLLRHVLRNQEDMEIVESLASAALPALNYEFFTGLTAEIDKQEMAGQKAAVARLTKLRDRLLKLQAEISKQSEQMLEESKQLLETVLAADNLPQAVQANMGRIDDMFMYLLAAEMDRAEQDGKKARLQKLEQVHNLIMDEIEGQTPPEIQLLNKLVHAPDQAEQARLLEESRELLSDDLLKVVDLLQDQVKASGQTELVGRLGQIKQLIAARLPRR